MKNKSINIKEEIKKKFRDSYIVLSDEGGYARVWGKEEDDVDIESFLSNSLDRMREETAEEVLNDIYNLSDQSEDINDGTLALVLNKDDYEKIESKYKSEEKPKA